MITKYTSRYPVEAIQFTGNNVEEIKKFIDKKKKMSIYIIIYLAGVFLSLLLSDSTVREYPDMIKDMQEKCGIGSVNTVIICGAVLWPVTFCYLVIDAIIVVFFDNKH